MFALPELPYAYDALEPTMSERTLHFHHDKHHRTYVVTLNEMLGSAGKQPDDLESVIVDAAWGGDRSAKLFNNAAQAWNHAFLWNSMTPAFRPPSTELASAINGAFGGVDDLGDHFAETGAAHFGSGWVWLTADRSGELAVEATHDAKDMVTDKQRTPLLVCDLWEHAYYLDYQNDRKGYLQAWFDKLANWDFAEHQWRAADGSETAWRYPAPKIAAAVR